MCLFILGLIERVSKLIYKIECLCWYVCTLRLCTTEPIFLKFSQYLPVPTFNVEISNGQGVTSLYTTLLVIVS